MNSGDPTEYRFAIAWFGSWQKWQEIASDDRFKSKIEAWRKELEIKIRSESLARIMEVAKNEGTRDSLQANKYLLEANWLPKQGKGRPSKEAIELEAKKLFREDLQRSQDYKRLFGEKENQESKED